MKHRKPVKPHMNGQPFGFKPDPKHILIGLAVLWLAVYLFS